MFNSIRIFFGKVIMIFLVSSLTGCVKTSHNDKTGSYTLPVNFKGNETEIKNIFNSQYPTTDMEEFKIFAGQMARLKPYNCFVQGRNFPPTRNLSSMLVAAWPDDTCQTSRK